MRSVNILGKEGFLTNEERKQKLEHGCEWLSFSTSLDLTKPVKVVPFSGASEITVDRYSQDLAAFIVWWKQFVMKDLNGFSGFGNVKFELVGFKLV